MALFQKSVIQKYLNELDNTLVQNQYALFKSYFQNTTIQKNIIASKEEEFQEGFLRELFVKILGYTINPEPNYNLVTELKNEKDSKKADGAILSNGLNPLSSNQINETVIAVIELKSTTTTDLNKIEVQAFNYKNNQQNCVYVITSNFQKIRLYIDNAIEHLEWDLFKLDEQNFRLMFLCLNKESILSNTPLTIKKESIVEEENITKKLYKEYSSFRKNLFNSIVDLNPNTNKLLLFKKTQKLLDRFLFLFFAEDRMLVPPNSVRLILDQWNTLKEMDAYQTLYDRFKLYFGYLNNGHKGKVHEIFAYNGGLFAADEILDNIKINDEILYNATYSLSKYDYNSDVDVNILGHIFEHSLTEIEELENEILDNNELNNTNNIGLNHTYNNGLKPIEESINPIQEKKKSLTTKRKKDGVFYTPKYITKYIVENTVGTLCKNKKNELNLQEEDYHTLTKKEKKKLYTVLQDYKTWLLQITIIDPACGSGAFLNQALEFLIAEHKWISELEANITGSTIVFDIENSILENNLFGVDINDESVEIAKLSLWLRTAQKGRKLNSLNNNIKCGNSLIDDANIAGDKAFNWQKEFPKIFNGSDYCNLYFVTFVTHNSRVSERMVTFNSDNFIENIQPFILDANDRIVVAKTIIDLCKKEKSYLLALNILPDHVHLIIAASSEKSLDEKIRKIKGKSSFDLNRSKEIGKAENKVWAQKFHWQKIESRDSFSNIKTYIDDNHYKHSDSWGNKIISEYDNGLKPIVSNACTNIDDFYETKSGFDVVIGNPPYVSSRGIKNEDKNYFKKYFFSAIDQFDLYVLFIEKGINILKEKGFLCFITPDKFLVSKYGEGILSFLKDKAKLVSFWDLTKENVFYDASVYPVIFNFNKTNPQLPQSYIKSDFINKSIVLIENKNETILSNIEKVEKVNINAWRPLATSKNIIDGEKLVVSNGEINRYTSNPVTNKISNGSREMDSIANKIILKKLCFNLEAYYDNIGLIPINTTYCLTALDDTNLKYIIAIINSKLLSFYARNKYISTSLRGGYIELRVFQIQQLPIFQASSIQQQPFIHKAEIMLSKNKELQQKSTQFIKLLTSKFETLNINTKLEKWYNLSFSDFSKELSKQKIKLSLQQESDWLQYFEEQKKNAVSIKNEIDKTDKEIDQMVYKLYNLTADEIKIVEGG